MPIVPSPAAVGKEGTGVMKGAVRERKEIMRAGNGVVGQGQEVPRVLKGEKEKRVPNAPAADGAGKVGHVKREKARKEKMSKGAARLRERRPGAGMLGVKGGFVGAAVGKRD